jgi:hypothetical protein
MWLLSNGREQHEPDSHRRERNPEGSTERNPEGRERDVSLPRSLVGSGEFGAVRMSGRRHDLGIGATGLSDSPRLGDEQERHWPHAGERPRDGETTSSRATASGVRTRRPGDAVRAGLLPRSRSRCGRRGVPGERPGRSTGANVVVPGSCAHCRWRGRTERRPLVEKRLGLSTVVRPKGVWPFAPPRTASGASFQRLLQRELEASSELRNGTERHLDTGDLHGRRRVDSRLARPPWRSVVALALGAARSFICPLPASHPVQGDGRRGGRT